MNSFFIITLLFSSIAFASSSEHNIAPGEFHYQSKKIKDAPWPQITIHTLLDNISPEEAAAIFSNYHNQKKFVPDMLESKVVKIIAPDDIHVAFIMDNPWPIDDEKYTTGNVLSRNGETFTVNWYLVESKSLIDTRGEVCFSKHSSGKTLMKYTSFVHPKSKLAFLASAFVKSKITNSIKSIATYLQNFKASKSEQLKVLTAKMDEILRNSNPN